MKTLFSWSFMALLGAGMPCAAQKIPPHNIKGQSTVQNTPSRSLERQVDSIINPLLSPGGKTAGVAVGIVQDGTPLLMKAYGKADLEWNVPLTIDASFEIGSITKQFTAVAILQLVEKGLIDLNDPVNKYIPFNTQFPVTVNHLLHHTSGIKDPPKPVYQSLERFTYNRDTVVRLIEKEGFIFEPGTSMLYSNSGYNMLGLIIEKVSGLPYEQYLQKNVFEPAGMENSFYTEYQTIRKGRARGYNHLPHISKDLILAEQMFQYWVYSSGALSSTVADMLNWLNVLHHTEKILTKKFYNELIAVGQLNDNVSFRYAKGTTVLNPFGYTMLAHSGMISGFTANAAYFPEKKLSIVYLRNTLHMESPNSLVYAIVKKILPPRKATSITFKGDMPALTGTYRMPEYIGENTVTVEHAGSALLMKRSWVPTVDTLTYIGNRKWSLGDDYYSFVMENGKAKEMIWDNVAAVLRLNRK